jgi:hypothetical protein
MENKRIIKKITLNQNTTDKDYRRFVEMCENDGVLLSCGNPDNKFVIVKFADEIDEAAWLCAKGLAKPVFVNDKTQQP